MRGDWRSRLTYGQGRTGASLSTEGSSVAEAEHRTGQTGGGSAEGKFLRRVGTDQKSTPILATSNFGATWGALGMHVARVFRRGSSALSEAAAISMAEGPPFAVEVVRRHLLGAMFAKFRLDEGRSGFDVDGPIPRGGPFTIRRTLGTRKSSPLKKGTLETPRSDAG